MAVSLEAQPARAKVPTVSPHHEDRAAMVPPVSAPQRVAPNRQAMHRLTHHCNCNDLNSMFERVAGELHAKLLGRRGLAGLRGAAPSHPAHRKRRRSGGRRRERRAWPRCRWAVAGPGRASRRRAGPKARGADGSRAGRRPPAHPAARPHSRALRRPEHKRCHTATTRGADGERAGRPRCGRRSVGEQATAAGFTRPRGGRPHA